MATYTITRPQSDVLRVEFPKDWDAEKESGDMFHMVLEELDKSIESVTLLIVAGQKRPVYTELSAARAVLTHDDLKQIIVVAPGAQQAINHMGIWRAEHGLHTIHLAAFDTEEAALNHLAANVAS
ncbi:MAG: hypothetical protein K8I82_31830 [Anaerolineae bacterium]|nr:hypothetical protein [Anaerolineae bacterium]